MVSQVEQDGYAIIPGVFGADEVAQFLKLAPNLDGAAGTRNLLDLPWCRDLALDRRLIELVREAIGEGAIPVRGILFDKTAAELPNGLAWVYR